MATNYTLQQDYIALSTTHQLYLKHRDRWQFLYESYVGGQDYRDAGHLTRYQLESDGDYQLRLRATPLDNQCAAVVGTYISFLFRTEIEREFGTWEARWDVESFLEDCDWEGRSFDDFMKQLAIWSSVFGHCWCILTKPGVGAVTAAQEQRMNVRPFINLMTPLVVSDFTWQRRPNGSYELVYLKYIEEVVDRLQVVKVWRPDRIETWEMDQAERTANLRSTEVNGLGVIPAVLVYNDRSIERGIGVSDINDIADVQRMLYNLNSENEQAIRLGTHPTLVVPPNAQVGAGAGALIILEQGSDPGLNPYALEFSSSAVGSIHETQKRLTESIDRMANTGGVRTTASREMSGVALETEFQLLNARLSAKADNLELAEEQIWQLFGRYQGITWEGEISYPDSFGMRDTNREIQELATARSAATDPRVLAAIDHEILETLGEDADLIMPEYVATAATTLPPEPLFEAHRMRNPETGDEVIARTEAEHIAYMEQGYIHKEED